MNPEGYIRAKVIKRKVVVVVVDRFYIALFSAIQHSHCAHDLSHMILSARLAFDSAVFLNIHPSGALTALFGCYMAGGM